MKRILATTLWLYAFWALGSLVSALVSAPDLLGPVLGISAGLLVGIDPRHVFWAPRPASASSPATAPTAA